MKITIDSQKLKSILVSIYMSWHRCGPIKIDGKRYVLCDICMDHVNGMMNRIKQLAEK